MPAAVVPDGARANANDRRRISVWLFACILLALALRAHDLGGQSLWWDESLSLHRAQASLTTILTNRIMLTDGERFLPTVDNHPPLYFLLLAATVRLLGMSEFALRLPSLFFSLLLVPLIYATGSIVLGKRAARYAAFFAAVSPLFLWYAQEARMYTMAPFMGLLSVYCLLRLLGTNRRHVLGWVLAYVAATIAMLLTHYLTLFVLAAEGVLVFFALLRARRLARLAWAAVVLLLAAGLVVAYGLTIVPPPQAGFVPIFILGRDVLNSFSLGLSVRVDEVIWFDLFFLAVAVLGLFHRQEDADKPSLPSALVILVYFALPFCLTYVAGYIRPVYMTSRHLIVVTPPFYLALGAGLAGLSSPRWLRHVAAAAMIAAIAFSSHQYFTNPAYQKDDHRSWGEYLRAHVQPGDVVVVNPPHIHELYRYYADGGLAWVGLPRLLEGTAKATADALERLATQKQNIWLAQSNTPLWGDPDRLPEGWLDANLSKTDEVTFHALASLVRVSRYATRPPTLVAPPAPQFPAEADLEGRLMFLGHDVVRETAEPGQAVGLRLYWRAGPRLDGEYKISLRLVDETGQTWALADHQPANGFHPTTRWQTGDLVRDDTDLLVPLATPPGTYHVQMIVYAASSGQPLSYSVQGGPGRTTIVLGNARVVRPQVYPSASVLPLTERTGARIGPLTLMGVRMDRSSALQGETTTVEAYWRADEKPRAEYLVRVSLVDTGGRVQRERRYALTTPGHGTLSWQQHEVVRGVYHLDVPKDIAAGLYDLRFALEDVGSGHMLTSQPVDLLGWWPGRQAGVARLNIIERTRVRSIPAIGHPLSANLGDKVSLLGYDLASDETPVRLQPGRPITITLYFQAITMMDTSYSVFMHVVDGENRMWGQQDQVPRGGSHPTSVWLPGEVVSDTLAMTLRPDAPAGTLRVIAGLYDPITSTRIPVLGGDQPGDSVLLFYLQVPR